MEKGRSADWLAKLAADDPDAAHLASAAVMPEEAALETHSLFAMQAFQDLKHDRQFGAMGGVLPLTFSAIDAYARRFGIEGEAFDRFIILIRALDGVWVEAMNRRDDDAEKR